MVCMSQSEPNSIGQKSKTPHLVNACRRGIQWLVTSVSQVAKRKGKKIFSILNGDRFLS